MGNECITEQNYTGGRRGWPWTEDESTREVSQMRSRNCQRISIITPSFNQGEYIEETIRSVLLQEYPNLEYIVIDGGSTDNTVPIITKYERWLSYWVSEKDRGQTHAINKGFRRATGEILAWLNSDDVYAPGALSYVSEKFNKLGVNWLAGGGLRWKRVD